MNNLNNETVNDAAFKVVEESVWGAMGGAVSGAVVWAVRRAVYGAVHWAVKGAVKGAVRVAVYGDPHHPALQDFLREAR